MLQESGDGIEAPSARGWLAASFWEAENAVVLQGGLNSANDRLGDLWSLHVEIA
jgi:hypothetical protein